jgi:hypothetical protein
LSIDPKVGTTLQPYAFVGGDPLNGTDPLGLWSFNSWFRHQWGRSRHTFHRLWHKLANVVHKRGWNYTISEGASFVPYTAYYASYKALKYTQSPALKVATAPLRPVLVATEAIGLSGDAAIDTWKSATIKSDRTEGVNDEGFRGPLFGDQTGFGGPVVYLPGIHRNWHVDFAF